VYRPGANVTFQCQPGYVLRGSRAAKCQPDGRWAPAVPACEPGERDTLGLGAPLRWGIPKVGLSAALVSLQAG